MVVNIIIHPPLAVPAPASFVACSPRRCFGDSAGNACGALLRGTAQARCRRVWWSCWLVDVFVEEFLFKTSRNSIYIIYIYQYMYNYIYTCRYTSITHTYISVYDIMYISTYVYIYIHRHVERTVYVYIYVHQCMCGSHCSSAFIYQV